VAAFFDQGGYLGGNTGVQHRGRYLGNESRRFAGLHAEIFQRYYYVNRPDILRAAFRTGIAISAIPYLGVGLNQFILEPKEGFEYNKARVKAFGIVMGRAIGYTGAALVTVIVPEPVCDSAQFLPKREIYIVPFPG